MKCSKFCCRRRKEIRKIAILLIAIGIMALLVLFLPPAAWMFILAIAMIVMGYNLFTH